MTNKLSSTNIAALLEEHLKSLNDINQVIVKANVDANVINNINNIIKPVSESVKALNIITNSLSQMMFISIKSAFQYKHGIKTIINTVTTIFETLNGFEINDAILYKYQKSLKPLSNLIKSLNEIASMLNTMPVSNGIKSKLGIKSILNSIKYITDNISDIVIEDEADKKFNKISDIVKSLSGISKNLLIIGVSSILITGLKKPILDTIELLKEISNKITEQLKDVKIYVNAERSIEKLKVIIGNIKDTTKDLIIIALFSPILVGLSKFITQTIKLMVDLCNELAKIDKNAAKAATNAAIIGKSLGEFAKGILTFVVASFGGLIFILGIIALLAMKVFMTVLFWLFSEEQMARMANSIAVINSMSKTMIMLTGMIILWALVGMLIGSAWVYILKTVMFVVIAILVFTLLGFLSKYIDGGNKAVFAIAATLIILSLTVVIWALTGELITEEMSNIWNVVLFVGIAIGCFVILSLFDRFIKGGSKTMLAIAATLLILSLTIVIWALTGELINEEMSNIWNVVLFVGIAIVFFVVLGFIGKYLKEGGKNLVMIALALILISLTVWLWVEIGQKVMDNWQQVLVVAGFVAVCVLLMWGLSKMSGNLIKGTVALVIMAVGLALLSVVTLLMIHVGNQIVENWVGLLAISVFMVIMVGIFAVIGIPAVFAFVALGAVAMVLIGAALLIFSVSVLILVNAIKKLEWEDLGKMAALIGVLGASVGAIGLIMPAIVLGSIALGILGAALIVFMIPVLLFVAVLKILKSIEATDEDIKKPIQMMGTLISEINNVFGNDALIAIPLAAAKVMALVPVALAVGIIAETLQNLSNLRMATAFNSEGKPIKFVKMQAKDFATAGQNAIGMIKIMASIFGDEEKPVTILGKTIQIKPLTEKELEGISNKSKRKIRQLSKITGFAGNIAETLQNIASLRLATEFNSEGKPIKFKNMDAKDFATAGENASGIVKILASLFTDNGFTGEILGEKVIVKGVTESDLNNITGKAKRKMKRLSKITGYIGTITGTIGSIATLNIPVGFNEEGQANKFEKITPEQLSGASENISGIIKMLGGLLAGDKNGNSFTVTIGGKPINITPLSDDELDSFSDRTRRKMEKLNDITLSVRDISTLVAEIGRIQIPNNFNPSRISELVNSLITSLGEIRLNAFQTSVLGISFNNGRSGILTDLMNAVSQIGQMSDMVSELAAMDNDGFTNAQTRVSSIIDTVGRTFSSLFTGDDPAIPELNRSQENSLQKFKEFVTSIKEVSEIDTDRLTTVTTAIRALQTESSGLYQNLQEFIDNLNTNVTALKTAVEDLNTSIGEYNTQSTRIQTNGNNTSGNNTSGNSTRSNNTENTPARSTQQRTNSGSDKTLNDIYNCVDAIEWLLDDIRRNTVTNNNVNY